MKGFLQGVFIVIFILGVLTAIGFDETANRADYGPVVRNTL